MKKIVFGIILALLSAYLLVRVRQVDDEYKTTDPLRHRLMGVNVLQFLNHHHDVQSLANALRNIRGVMLTLINASGVRFVGKNIAEKTGDGLNWDSADVLYRLDHPEALPSEVPYADIVAYVDEQNIVLDFELPASLLVAATIPRAKLSSASRVYWTKAGQQVKITKKFRELQSNFRNFRETFSNMDTLYAMASDVYTAGEIEQLSSQAAFDQMLLEVVRLYSSQIGEVQAPRAIEKLMFTQSQNWMTKYLKACRDLHPGYFLWLQVEPFYGMGLTLLFMILIVIQLRRQDLFVLVHRVLTEKLQSTTKLEIVSLIFHVIRKHLDLLIWQPPDEELCAVIAPSCSEVVREYHTRKQLRALAKEARNLAAALKERFHDSIPKSLAGLLKVASSKIRPMSVREDALQQLHQNLQLRASRNGKHGHSTPSLPPSSNESYKNGVPEAERIRKEVINSILALCRESVPESCAHIDARFFESFSRRKLEMCEHVVRFLTKSPGLFQKFFELSQAQIKGLLNDNSTFMNAILDEDHDVIHDLLSADSNGNYTSETTPSQFLEDVSHFLAGKRVVIFGGARTHISDIQNRLVEEVKKLGAASCEFRYCNDFGRMFSSMNSRADVWIMLIGTVPHLVKEKLASERCTELLINVRYVNADRFRNEVIQKIKQAESSHT